MNPEKTTVSVSGGIGGIGFATARLLTESGNRVVMTMLADMTKEDVIRRTDEIKINSPALNVLINNREKVFVNQVSDHAGAFEKSLGRNSDQLFVGGQTFHKTARNC